MTNLRGRTSQENYEKAVEMIGFEPVNRIGTCFESVGKTVLHIHPRPKDLKIFQALIVANIPGSEGKDAMHTWYEHTEDGIHRAFDTTWGYCVPVEQYRKGMKIKFIVGYSLNQFLHHWMLSGYPGPWDNRISI